MGTFCVKTFIVTKKYDKQELWKKKKKNILCDQNCCPKFIIVTKIFLWIFLTLVMTKNDAYGQQSALSYVYDIQPRTVNSVKNSLKKNQSKMDKKNQKLSKTVKTGQQWSMCGMVPKMCGMVTKMCSKVQKCATWCQKCAS